MVEIIGITGFKRSGKDTLGARLIERGYTRVAFADSLKDACMSIFGFSESQTYGDLKETLDPYWGYKPRDVFQKVGTELFRDNISNVLPNIGSDIWIRSLERKIQNLQLNGHTKFVITDVRFDNEVEFVKKLGGSIIKVVRLNQCIEPSLHESDLHESERGIPNDKCDHIIFNNSTIQDLHDKLDRII